MTGKPKGVLESERDVSEIRSAIPLQVCITKTERAESEAQRSKPKGALGSESRNAIL